MARHGQLAPAAQREPVDGRDDRFAARLEAAQHPLAAQRAGLAVEGALFGEVADVGARDEGLGAGPGDDGALDRVFGRDALGRVAELGHHLVVQGVELVGAVDGDERDALSDLEEEDLVAHGGEWYTESAECGMWSAE